MSCCIAIGFFELPGLAGGFLYTKRQTIPAKDRLFQTLLHYFIRFLLKIQFPSSGVGQMNFILTF